MKALAVAERSDLCEGGAEKLGTPSVRVASFLQSQCTDLSQRAHAAWLCYKRHLGTWIYRPGKQNEREVVKVRHIGGENAGERRVRLRGGWSRCVCTNLLKIRGGSPGIPGNPGESRLARGLHYWRCPRSPLAATPGCTGWPCEVVGGIERI